MSYGLAEMAFVQRIPPDQTFQYATIVAYRPQPTDTARGHNKLPLPTIDNLLKKLWAIVCT